MSGDTGVPGPGPAPDGRTVDRSEADRASRDGAGRVVSVGSVNLDHTLRVPVIPAAGETMIASTLTTTLGGKSCNQAVAAARLGATVELVALLGDDDLADDVLGTLAADGISTEGVRRRADVLTGRAYVTVDDAGENSIVVLPGANDHLRPDPAVLDAVAGADVALFALEVPLDTVIACIEHASRHDTRVVLNPSPARSLPDAVLSACAVVIVNRHELGVLVDVPSEQDAWDDVARRLAERRLPDCVVTLGSEGAVVLHAGDVTVVPPVPITAVDSTGSGDAFAGALAAGLAAGEGVVAAAVRAAAVGAFTATGHGAGPSYPTREQLEDWLATRAAP